MPRMADYFVTLTIPKNTILPNISSTTVTIEGDILVGFFRLIPPGWAGLAHYRIKYGLEQLHPANEGAWDTGDNIRDFVPLNWKMPEHKLTLTIEGYNEDTTYDHTVYLWFRTEEVEYARPTTLLKEILLLLKEIFGVES